MKPSIPPDAKDVRGIKLEKSVTVQRSAEQLYRFWRDLENLPRIMDHVESVQKLDERRSHWKVKGPAGSHVEWDAEVITDVENELIGWRSVGDAAVQNAGSVRFEPAGAAGTEVKVTLSYEPPAGRAGAAVAKLFGKEPSQEIEHDLHRFKELMEDNTRYPENF